MDVDYKLLPPLLNLDFHQLNGLLPITTSRFDYLGKNATVNGKESTLIEVNPSPEEYEYYRELGVTEFQAVQIVIHFFAFEETEPKVLRGRPYSVSLVPMQKNSKIDPWHIDLLKQFDLRQICQEGGDVMTGFDPFNPWHEGLGMDYGLFSQITNDDHFDDIGFVWGMYFLAPKFDKKEVQILKNKTYSNSINAKYRRYKIGRYFRSFDNINPGRIWGCDSPIELFLLQGLYTKGLIPEIQYGFYRNGDIYPNYYRMQEVGEFVGEHKLITSADFYFENSKLAIFCDGKEFHDKDKDARIDKSLKDIGIRTMRFSGKRITEDLEKVLDEIVKENGL